MARDRRDSDDDVRGDDDDNDDDDDDDREAERRSSGWRRSNCSRLEVKAQKVRSIRSLFKESATFAEWRDRGRQRRRRTGVSPMR